MIRKVVNKRDLHDFSSIKEDLIYWLSKTPEERVAVVDYLRKQYHGSTERLQRSARVIKRS
jgi:hypothetical protein